VTPAGWREAANDAFALGCARYRDQNGWAAVSNFEPSNFVLASDFEFRISDFTSSWLGLG
jgi:hypothetical protein